VLLAGGVSARLKAAARDRPILCNHPREETMTLNKMLCFVIAVLWLVLGCRTAGGPDMDTARPQQPEGPAAPSGEIPLLMAAKGGRGFIRLLEERSRKIHSFRARIVLSASGKYIPSYENLAGVLIASEPGLYRITGYSERNKAVFDFLTLRRTTALRWAPEGNDIMSAEAEARQRPDPKFMENLSLVMGAGPFPQADIVLDNRVDKDLVVFLLEQQPTERFLTRNRRIWFSGKEILATRIEEKIFDNSRARLNMADYHLVDSNWIPFHLSLSYHDILVMDISLKSIKLNDTIDERLFDPDVVPTAIGKGM